MNWASKKRFFQTCRLLGPFGIAAICVVVLLGKVEAASFAALPEQLSQLTLGQVMIALAATMVSFWAVGRYDIVTHRLLGTGIDAKRAKIAGTSAIALSQTLGLGVFSAAIARWRLLPDLSLPQALRVSAFVSVSFLVALGVICALAFLILPMPAWFALPAALILLVALALLAACMFCPVLRLGRWQVQLPTLRACGAIFGWTLVDTCAAGIALYALMPTTDLALAMLLPAYLLALGAALLSGAPGGVGPFELALLALLPQVAEPEVLAGALAFRVIYYALPAALGGIALIWPLTAPAHSNQHQAPALKTVTPPAEMGVLHQNGGRFLAAEGTLSAIWQTPQTLTMLFNPIVGNTRTALKTLRHAAQAENRIPTLYKCNARTAIAARTEGWQVVHVADEALLDPTRFDLSDRRCRDLRRKLRQGERANITTERAGVLPIPDMGMVDREWQQAKGGARGGSMGRFCPAYLKRQRVYLAYEGERLVGYISLHIARQDWCLDLMRQVSHAPNGVMQLLVHHALRDAAELGITRFSLDCVPATPKGDLTLPQRVATAISKSGNANGLRRFKSSFAPSWQPRYAAALGYGQLTLALFDLALIILRPPPLPDTTSLHKDDEECEVAPQNAP